MKFGKLSVGIATAVLLGTSFVGTVDAATYVQRSNAISQYSGSSLRILNNSNVQFVKAGNYGWSKNPSGRETIKSVHGTKWTLKTKYLLPNTHMALGKSSRDVTNPQAAAFGGKYLFVLYAPHQFHGKGFIVRYNRSTLDNMSLSQAQDALTKKTAGMKVGRCSMWVTANRWHTTRNSTLSGCGATDLI